MTAAAPSIVVDRVTKRFDDVTAVDDVTLEIRGGEFFSMLGPSGCGKTTTLRIVAGFEAPTSGRVLVEGRDITPLGPAKRNLNMVFQEYALFPHMTVAENIAFGLQIKRVPASERRSRVADAVRSMQLEGMTDRRPAQLSGGQRQRVALARALVNRPAALLLDEPLGALDFKLRKSMQLELKSVQQRTGTTFVYVTHDQEEALTMSDRIAVMDGGVVMQVAEPRTIYEQPANAFVAGFIGTSNLLALRVDRREGGRVAMELGDGMRIVAPDGGGSERALQITIRPEKMRIAGPEPAPEGCSRVGGRVEDILYLGSMTQYVVALPTGERLTVHRLNDSGEETLMQGSPVTLTWPPEHSFVIGSAPEQPPAPAPAEALL